MDSTRRLQSGHWAGDPEDANTQRVVLATPGVNSALFLEHLKRPVVRPGDGQHMPPVAGHTAEGFATVLLLYWPADWSVFDQFLSSDPPSILPGYPLCPSLGCHAHQQPGKDIGVYLKIKTQ